MSTDRRQEVIDYLIECLNDDGLAYTDSSPAVNRQRNYKRAEALYDKIVPLFGREFPEEAVLELCQRYKERQEWLWEPDEYPPPPKYTFEQLLADLKRIWEGDHIAKLPEREFPEEKVRMQFNEYTLKAFDRTVVDHKTRVRVLDQCVANVKRIWEDSIPKDERWAWENPEIRASLKRAFEDIKAGRIETVEDLDVFLDSLGDCPACTGVSICDSTKTDKYYIRKEGYLFWTGPEENGWVREFDIGAWEANTMDEAQRVFTANCPNCHPKGDCPTCGGSKRVSATNFHLGCNEKCQIPSHWKSCPDCPGGRKNLRHGVDRRIIKYKGPEHEEGRRSRKERLITKPKGTGGSEEQRVIKKRRQKVGRRDYDPKHRYTGRRQKEERRK